MADTLTEGGLRDHRIDYSPEEIVGTMEAGGTFDIFGKQITTFDWGPDAAVSPRRAIGDPNPQNFDRGPESHDLTIDYYLQGEIDATYRADTSMDCERPICSGMLRNDDNLIPYSYTVVDREKFHSGGTQGTGYRTYVVVEGFKPGNPSMPGDPGDGAPIEVSLSGQAEKIRSYRIDQPSTSITDIAFTGGTGEAIVQDDTGGTTPVTLGGTSTSTYPETTIDAVYLTKEATGVVKLYEGTDDTGPQLMEIKGSDSYDNLEGDRGVPYHKIRHDNLDGVDDPGYGTTYQSLVGDTIQWAGDDLAFAINSAELSVNQNLETSALQGKKRQRIFASNRDIELTTTVYGKDESRDKTMSYLQKESGNIEWNMDSNTITVQGAVLTDSGNRTVEDGQAFMETDTTFNGTSLAINHS